MKKVAMLLLALSLVFSAGCGEKKQEASKEPVETGPVNLSEMSSTMVYSEVSNMLAEPNKYKGRTVTMKGNFAAYHDEATGKDYFACVVLDATACCQQGIEFEIPGAKYPENFPELGTEIVVEGTFST